MEIVYTSNNVAFSRYYKAVKPFFVYYVAMARLSHWGGGLRMNLVYLIILYLVNAGQCGVSVSKLHNGLEMLLSLSKFKVDVANIIVMLPPSYDR